MSGPSKPIPIPKPKTKVANGDLAVFLSRVRRNSAPSFHRPRRSISEQFDFAQEPGAAEVAALCADIKQNPGAYDGVRKELIDLAKKEKKVVDQAIEDLEDLQYEVTQRQHEKKTHATAKEIAWLERDLEETHKAFLDAIRPHKNS